MQRSPRHRVLRAGAIVFALAPFAFGLIRYFSARHDPRMLWMVAASLVVAVAMRAVAQRRGASSVPAVALATFVVTTLVAGAVAQLLGARALFGSFAVAAVFGICWAASYALDATSRRDE